MELICGIDEAGRGPLAGPVTAAAVILPERFPLTILRDSKQMSVKQRDEVLPIIMEKAIAWGVGWVWPEEIDRMNIHNAALEAMLRSYHEMGVLASRVLVDGRFVPPGMENCEAIVKGDRKIPEIQAASIIAKTLRDRWMIRYSWIEPDWLFDQHKGYPTIEHRRRCLRYGLSPIHRKSFRISLPHPA